MANASYRDHIQFPRYCFTSRFVIVWLLWLREKIEFLILEGHLLLFLQNFALQLLAKPVHSDPQPAR